MRYGFVFVLLVAVMSATINHARQDNSSVDLKTHIKYIGSKLRPLDKFQMIKVYDPGFIVLHIYSGENEENAKSEVERFENFAKNFPSANFIPMEVREFNRIFEKVPPLPVPMTVFYLNHNAVDNTPGNSEEEWARVLKEYSIPMQGDN